MLWIKIYFCKLFNNYDTLTPKSKMQQDLSCELQIIFDLAIILIYTQKYTSIQLHLKESIIMEVISFVSIMRQVRRHNKLS